VAKRRKDDEPDRPYRWSDTPFDPLASPGRGGGGGGGGGSSRRWLSWLVVIVLLVAVVAIGRGWFRSDSKSSAPRRPSTTTTSTSVAAVPGPGPGQSTPSSVVSQVGPAASAGPTTVGTPQRAGSIQAEVVSVTTSGQTGAPAAQRFLTASVTVANVGSERLGYGVLKWEIQFPDGKVVAATPTMQPGELALSGGLAAGASVSGTVTFDVTGGGGGTYEIRYRDAANPVDRDQLTWLVPLS